MNHYTEAIQSYLNQHTPCYGSPVIHSMLEFLWVEYGEYNLRDNETIRENNRIMGECMEEMTLPEADRLFEAVCAIAREYERLAFLEGAQVGMRLALELNAVE